MTKPAYLNDFEVLNGISDADLLVIEGLLEKVSFHHGEVIIEDHAEGSSLYLILSGKVQLYKTTPGSINFICMLEPKDIFGELSFIDQRSRSAGASAIGEVTAAKMDRSSFDKLKAEHPGLCADLVTRLMMVLAQKFRALSQGVELKSAEHALLELIVEAREVKISTAAGVDYICVIQYADTRSTTPLLRVDVRGQKVFIPFAQIQAISLPNSFGRY